MPNITIRGLPAGVHRSLKAQAKRNGRSLNQEIVRSLTTASAPIASRDVAQQLAEIERLIAEQRADGVWVTPEEIEEDIQAGRQ